MMKVDVFILVYHPVDKFLSLLHMLERQKGATFTVHIVDSAAMGTEYKEALNELDSTTYKKISASSFNHGGTRQQCLEENPDSDISIFFTQDAVPADDHTIANIIETFADPSVGCAYGRQLPHSDANPFARFARFFNYKDTSYTYCFADRAEHGIKTVFCSDSFAAYRYRAMKEIGGFPKNVILSEDMYVAAKMLIAGWKISYSAEAKVLHSHNYSIIEEFKRYYSIGIFHGQEPWIRRTFGNAEGEGKRYIMKEFAYIYKISWRLVPEMMIRDAIKYIGYKIGNIHSVFTH